MKKAQLIGYGIAGVAALVAVGGMYKVMNRPQQKIVQTEVVDAVQVLVARADIGLGSVTTDASFRWQDWPKGAVSPAFITKSSRPHAMKEMTGGVARSPIIAGEPVTTSKLIQAGKGGVLAAILPPGMRAISTKITDQSAVGKLILPNDHVDVILVQRKRGRGGAEEHISDTLFRNVRVLAIGQQIEVKEGKKNADGNVATLELTPRQAESLALANSMGEIALALRSVADLAAGQGPLNGVPKSKETGSSIKVLRYGVKARAYGVN